MSNPMRKIPAPRCPAAHAEGSGTDQSTTRQRDHQYMMLQLTLLHLNVLLASPGMASANPFSHLVKPSSGYCVLFIAPAAISASHWACNVSQSRVLLRTGLQTCHFHAHDSGVHGAISVLFGRTQSSRLAQTHEGGAKRKRKDLDHTYGTVNNTKIPADDQRTELVKYSSAMHSIYISTEKP
jgi:hypothetical protein